MPNPQQSRYALNNNGPVHDTASYSTIGGGCVTLVTTGFHSLVATAPVKDAHARQTSPGMSSDGLVPPLYSN